jgi:hypothetical protein
LEAHSALEARCARLQAVIAQRKAASEGPIPIYTSFAETARWKRRVPRGGFSWFQGIAHYDVNDSS